MSAESRLRQVLALDAAGSAATAVAATVALDPLADLLEVDPLALDVAIAAIAIWVVAVGSVARSDRPTLLRWTPVVAAGNGAWVLATVGLHAAGLVDGDGWWVTVPLALLVGGLGLAQAWFWRSLAGRRTPATAPTAA